MRPDPRPPRCARLLASILLRADSRDIVIGDLDEELGRAIAAGIAPRRARRRYWRQALASVIACGRWRRSVLAPTGRTSVPPGPRLAALAGVAGDLRHGARVLARSPGFTAIAVLSLAIGIGANTAVYTVIRALVVAPLPVERPHELALIYWGGPARSGVRVNQINSSEWQDPSSGRFYKSNYTYPMFAAMREAAGPSADLFAFTFLNQTTVSIDGQPPVVVGGLLASGRYFTTMTIEMALGRPLGEHDDRPGAPPVVVISHGFWTRTFGGDPAALGKVIRVNGAPCEIAGVTARGYRGLSPGAVLPATDITLSLRAQPAVMPRWSASPAAGASLFSSNVFWVRILARVPAPSGGLARRMDEALRSEYARLPDAGAVDLGDVGVRLLPGARGLDGIRTDVQGPLQFLAGVAGIVLLMGCLNLSGLLLARGVGRARELAVRRALGAGRARLMRVLLIESLLLAAAGGICGVLLALWAGPLITSMLATGLGAGGVDLGIDWPLVAIAMTVAVVAALLSGLAPALRQTGRRVSQLTQRGDGAGARLATGRALIALQIAISVPLLVGAGLLLRTVYNLGQADLGFNPEGLVVFRIDPRLAGDDAERNPLPLYDRVLERVRALPGVTSAALVENVLVSGRTSNTDQVWLDGVQVRMSMNAVGPGFFDTMALPIVAGRAVGAEDRAGSPPVAVINEIAARQFFPGQSPIGRRLTIGKRDVEIVGVAGTTLYRNLRTPPQAMFYDAYAQRSFENLPGLAAILRSAVPSPMHVVLRTAASPAAVSAAIPDAVREVAPELAIPEIKTQVEQIEDTIARERLVTRLLVIIGGFAVLLACIGLHGVTAYSVARRTSEIGIRVALGAARGQVVWLILRQVLVVAAAGVALGVPIAIAAGPVLSSLLFGLAPRDGLTIAVAAAAMLAVALGAGWLPARRAARLPVIAALRRE